MASLRPDTNKNHDLGSSSKKWGTLHVGDVQAETMTTSGNVEIQGNLTVTGTQTSLQVSTVEAEDPLIKLARNNTADAIDIGFYGRSGAAGSEQYHGLARDADNGEFYLFEGVGTEPTTTMPNVASNKAMLHANVTGALTGNASTASTLETARTLSISGDVAGSVSFDGSGNVDIVSTIQAGSVENSMLAGSIADGKLAQDYLQTSEVDDSSIEFDALGGHIQVKASGITNAMLAGSIANSKLSNSSVSFGGVSVALGASDATPAFNLSDATGYPTAQLVGSVADSQLAQDYLQTSEVDNSSIEFDAVGGHIQVKDLGITNAMLAGSIANAKLSNSSISLGGVSISLGGTDATPAFDLADASGYPTASLVGTITNAQLAGAIANAKLANSSITFSDGTNTSPVSLGGTLTIQGTANEVEVAENAGTYTVGLPSTISAALNGNASTATALATGRNFSVSSSEMTAPAVSFDGTGNVVLVPALVAGSIANSKLANDGFSLSLGGVAQEDINLGDTLDFNGTASQVDIAYSAAGNDLTFSLPSTINVDTSGNAGTATALETARNIGITSGPVTAANVSFDGSGNVALTSAIANGAISNAMLANDKLVFQVGGVDYDRVLGSTIKFAATNLDINYSAVNNEITYGLPATIGSDTTGNAATATALETARNIQVTGDVVGSASFDGTANASIATTIASGAVDNVMLANSGITVSDTSNSETINLGDTLFIGGTGSEVDVTYSTALNKFTIGLPDSVSVTTNLDVGSGLTVGGNATITGNISAAGLTASGANVTFADNLIELGVNNTDLEDIGFYGQRGDGIGGTNGFAGIAFDESADEFIAFTSSTEPTTTVNGHSKAKIHASELESEGAVIGELRSEGTAPSTASSTGTAGDIRFDSGHLYVCTATNTWKRVAISSF